MKQFGIFGTQKEIKENLFINTNINPQIEESWKMQLRDEFSQPYFHEIKKFLLRQKELHHTIYPPGSLIFNAYNKTPFHKVKAVIIGQDPYHGKGQAQGLCFSVPTGVAPPPSLVNIFKEIHSDLCLPMPKTGNLEPWTGQGVFLLNAILSVQAGNPASHKSIGWEKFTDATIRKLSEERKGLVFLLWGKFAQEKKILIDASKHFILTAAHPSPYSANSGFLGCRHFSQTNEILGKQGLEPVDWRL